MAAFPQLRVVVIGAGAGVFNMHRPALQQAMFNVVAISDIKTDPGQQRAEGLGCAFYTDYQLMLAEMRPEVAVILTPHPLHARIAINCLEAGCHVLVEKPMAIQVSEADEMIVTALENKRLLEVVFQQRFRPEIRFAERLIEEGRLGDIQHFEMNVTWTRANSYFTMAPWRGTWKGEGGGVLMNQGSHNLDLLCHLMGLPVRVIAWTKRLLHTIETEDTAQAMLEWESGALGTIHISTAEVPQPEYIKIAGTGGVFEIVDGRPTLQILDTDLKEYVKTSVDGYAKPAMHEEKVELPTETKGQHSDVYRQFYDTILTTKDYTATAIRGRMELELANAMIYSSFTREEVLLPLERQAYAELLQQLQGGSAIS
jgi:predicted dehydrogenase